VKSGWKWARDGLGCVFERVRGKEERDLIE
jgi:hypothetical protein